MIPDIEKALVAHLAPLLAPVRVGTRVPNPRPDELVRVSMTGGHRRNLGQAGLDVLVECWAPDRAGADRLAQRVWLAFDRADGTRVGADVWVAHVSLGAPIHRPDPDTSHERYQFPCSFVVPLTDPTTTE